MSRSLESFYKFFDNLLKLVYVNVLWILFSMVGLFIFGFYPATVAMFGLIRKWLLGEKDPPIFRTFWEFYKKEFIKSNILGYLLLLVGYLIYLNFMIIEENNSSILQLFYYPLFTINLIFFLMILYIFPIFVHYNLKVFQVFKNACLIIFINPLISIIIICGTLIYYFVMITMPLIIPLFGGSILSYFLMYTSLNAFLLIEGKQNI